MSSASSSRISLQRAAVIVAVILPASLAAAQTRTPPGQGLVALDEGPPPELTDLSQLPRTQPAVNDEPRGPFPARPPAGEARTLSAAVALGPGWLALRDREGRD